MIRKTIIRVEGMNNNPNNFVLHHQLEADTLFITDLTLSQARLMNDSQFPWIILIPRKPDCVEIYDLSEQEILQLNKESIAVGKIMMKHFNGDKLNIAALGNMVPQLHIHHIVRFKHDISWPAPIWGKQAPIPYKANETDNIIKSYRQLLSLIN